MNLSLVYGISAVFFREFTKFNGYAGKTYLSLVHGHYFILGMFFFIILSLLEKNFQFSDNSATRSLTAYNTGLNLTIGMFLIRGIIQVKDIQLTPVTNGIISGIAEIGHIILGVSIILILLKIKKRVCAQY